MALHPPDPCCVHPLPAAPAFVGRDEELATLRHLWEGGFQGVLALVGLGGAGKTAVAARFLQEIARGSLPQPHGLFVWSFYQEPDAGRFLREAYDYFAGDAPLAEARGTGLLHLLRESLLRGGPNLLVLDGLERVQRQEGDAHGQVEDPLLKGLLTRIVVGVGRTAVLVTSRFPLADLEAHRGHGYLHLDVGGLKVPAALALLRQRGVRGDDSDLTRLVEGYGAHALTLDHLGGLIGQFLGGDPGRAPEAPALADPGRDRQALRLARLLRAYEEHLPPEQLALLCRLCLLRRSVDEGHLQQLFLCSPAVHARTVRELTEALTRIPSVEKYARWRLDNLAEALGGCVEEALCAAPIAGPEGLFRQEVLLAAEHALGLMESGLETDILELVRLYPTKHLDTFTDERPLPAEDRASLHRLCTAYLKLCQHPLTPFVKLDPFLAEAFESLGYGQLPPPPGLAELTPSDVVESRQRTFRGLRYLVGKHFALRRVRALCRLHQRKWALAGPLAPLDAAALAEVLGGLVARHLVLREADGSYSVHPAVRDHFGRLAAESEREGWHDLIRAQLISLSQRPGRRLPEDAVTLDLVEEAVHHALAAGRPREARELYEHGLGGLRHLGWKLGEMTRGLRILRGLGPDTDRWALGWYLRALGEMEEAYGHNDLPFFRADIRLLQGRLPAVAATGDSARTAAARFLMGQSRELPPDLLGCAVPRDQCLLLLGRLDRLRRPALLERLYHDIGWEADRTRCLLLLSEVARLQGAREAAGQHLETASAWILHAGSVEHLCLLHLQRARLARCSGPGPEAAQRALEEGLHLARQCGLGLSLIDLLCEQAELWLAGGRPADAEASAREAQERAVAEDCSFAWGAAQAGHLVGRALAEQGRTHEALSILRGVRARRQRLADPRLRDTEELLARVSG